MRAEARMRKARPVNGGRRRKCNGYRVEIVDKRIRITCRVCGPTKRLFPVRDAKKIRDILLDRTTFSARFFIDAARPWRHRLGRMIDHAITKIEEAAHVE